MKKEDLKKAYDDITISDAQKERIYQTIMKNTKKKHSFIPWISIGGLALAGCFAFMFFTSNHPSTNIPGTKVGGSVALANNYKKDVIVNATTYLNASNIDVTTLKDNEELVIDSNKIITDEKYQGCSGRLIIKRHKDGYTYTPETTCGEEDSEKVISYHIYDGEIHNMINVGEYTFIESHVNKSKSLEDDTYQTQDLYDANVLLFDAEGNLVWEHLLKRKKTDGAVRVKGIEQIDDMYLFVVEYEDDIYTEKNPDGSFSSDSAKMVDLVLLDKNGENAVLKAFTTLKKELASYTSYDLINTNDDSIIFRVYDYKENKNHFIEVNKSDLSIANVHENVTWPDNGSLNGIYGNKIIFDVYIEKAIYVYDANTRELVSKIVYPKNYDFDAVTHKNEKYYFLFTEDAKEDNLELYSNLWVYDNDFQKLHEEKLELNDWASKSFHFFQDNIHLNTNNSDQNKNYIYSFDANGKKIGKEEVRELDHEVKAKWANLFDYSYTSKGFNMIYTAKELTFGEGNNVNTNSENQILFVTIR